jgi:hypothetical protein
LKFSAGSKIYLNLRQTDAAFSAAARNDCAASMRRHPGAKAQFAGAWAFFRLPGAFHSVLSPRPDELMWWFAIAGKAGAV